MSVNCNTYVIIGVQVPYDEKFKGDDNYEKYEDYHDSCNDGIHHHNGLCMLSDGMSGKYVVIGKVLKKTENHRGFYDGPIDLCEIDADGEERKYVGSLIKAQFGIDKEPTVLVVSHYR